MTIVSLNPQSLWTPVLWGWGRTPRSCTLYAFTLNLQWLKPHTSPEEDVYRNPSSVEIRALGLHQQNVFQSLDASRSVWEDVECKLRCNNCRGVSYPRRAFRPAFEVSGISETWCRSTMRVMVISLRTPQSSGKSIESSWEYLDALETGLGVPTSCPGAPRKALKHPQQAWETPGSTSNHCTAVWEQWHHL